MQSLFAYDRCKEANIQLALNYLEDHFSPDLNSMEAQDKVLLKKQSATAKQQLLEHLAGKEAAEAGDDAAIRKEVKKALAINTSQTSKDLAYFKKNLVSDVEKINGYYYTVLQLLIDFCELAKSDKKSHLPLLGKNRIAAAFTSNAALQRILLSGKGLTLDANRTQSWYKEIIKPALLKGEFEQADGADIEIEKKVMKHLSRKLILNGTINDFFAEHDIRWTEDHDIVKSLVDKTIKSYNEDSQQVQVQKLSLDWEDDMSFMTTLFEKAATTEQRFKDLIASNTKNWEVDRLPLTDRIILEMAIAELISFPSIPVKVSINEYIELTKKYSTPKSPKFINGILDVIAKELQAEGTIKKSGRGLIDNK
ncbi:MAG: transcription antitermination factor NusB [Cyclobacteriaceae bacterium]